MSRVLIFVGPTLSSEQIHEIAPQAEIFPPVASGDLLRLSLNAGDLVAIIDGYYFQSASVRHKEILDLLYRGVHVWGAASMGALRAADLAPFGMRGFGSIFQAYRQGQIEGDDEVAVMHAPREMGYRQITEALVNIRYACQQGISEGILSADASRLIVEVASELPFFERSYSLIFKKAAERGLPQQVIDGLQLFIQQERLNVKKSDALTLVQALRLPPQEPFSPTFELQETSLLRAWKINEQGIFVKGQWIAYHDILAVYQLFGEDYPTVHYNMLLEHMAKIAYHHTHQGPDQKTDPSSLISGGLSSSAKESAAPLHSLALYTAQVAQFFSTQFGFRFDADLPANARKWLRADEMALSREEQFAHISVRVAEHLNWQEVMFQHIKTSSLFPALVKIVYQSRQFHNALLEQQSGVDPDRLSPEQMCAWFRRRWGVSESDFNFSIVERGFQSLSDFLRVARSFYLFDKYIGVLSFGGLLSA